jgi:hypothetical protein
MFDLDVVKYLNYGVIGLGAFFAVVAAILLKGEPKNTRPIYGFMIFSIILCLIGFASQYLDFRKQCEKELTATKQHYEDILHARLLLHKVSGKITTPEDGKAVAKTFHCTGSVAGLKEGMHLWLAVEVNGLIWPREPELEGGQGGKWTATVYEDGARSAFSLTLLVADEPAHTRIGEWITRGKNERGNYKQMDWFEGTMRLDRIDDLRLKDKQ